MVRGELFQSTNPLPCTPCTCLWLCPFVWKSYVVICGPFISINKAACSSLNSSLAAPPLRGKAFTTVSYTTGVASLGSGYAGDYPQPMRQNCVFLCTFGPPYRCEPSASMFSSRARRHFTRPAPCLLWHRIPTPPINKSYKRRFVRVGRTPGPRRV